jgi:ribonuclease E
MRGYLQRLAASVQPQASRIRPAVTPLYARGSAGDVREEPALEEGNFAVAARRDTPAPHEADVQVAKLAPPQPMARAALEFEAAAVERLVAEELRAAPDPRRARASENSAAEVVEAPRPEAPVRKTVAAGRSEARPAPALLVESHVTRREDAAPRAEPMRARAGEGRAASRPDEIHINIGRVEVIAAPPPAPRAAAPASKAVSLEDYLRGVSARRR